MPDKRLNIALIGPAPPYRSGIALHTMELQRALEPLDSVRTISFKRQYPQWLYPGNDKAPDTKRDGVKGVRYLIDVYNPLSWRRTADLLADEGCQVAILTWWTLFWQPGFSYILRRLKRRGVKTVFFCHNLLDHKTSGIMGLANSVLHRASVAMLKSSDAYIVQSKDQERQLLAIKPQAKILRRMHPINGRPIKPRKQLSKRGRLEVLFFGLIRPYKGLDLLLEAAERLHDEDVYFTIVGEPWGDAEAIKTQLANADIPHLDADLQYVSDDIAAAYFDRADVVVLPYKAATGSAVVALAYAYDKPVLATAVTGLVDAVIDGKTGWLVPPDSPEALAKALEHLTRTQAARTAPAIAQFRRDNSWPAMGRAVGKFIRQLLT